MKEADLARFFRRLAQALGLRVAKEWRDSSGMLRATGERFLEESSEDLARWSGLLAAGALNEQDYRWLVGARADLLKTEALANAGLGRRQVDRFRAALVETVVAVAIGQFVGGR